MDGTRLKFYFKGFLLGMVVCLVGCWQSCDYLRLRCFGRAADAQFTGFYQVDSDAAYQYARYSWTLEDGTPVRGRDSVSFDWQAPESGTVKIYYLPNAKILEDQRKSMLADKSPTWTLTMVLFGVLAMVVFGVVAYFMEQQEE